MHDRVVRLVESGYYFNQSPQIKTSKKFGSIYLFRLPIMATGFQSRLKRNKDETKRPKIRKVMWRCLVNSLCGLFSEKMYLPYENVYFNKNSHIFQTLLRPISFFAKLENSIYAGDYRWERVSIVMNKENALWWIITNYAKHFI